MDTGGEWVHTLQMVDHCCSLTTVSEVWSAIAALVEMLTIVSELIRVNTSEYNKLLSPTSGPN